MALASPRRLAALIILLIFLIGMVFALRFLNERQDIRNFAASRSENGEKQLPPRNPHSTIVQTPTPLLQLRAADINEDGAVDLLDFTIWRDDYIKGE